MSTEAASPGPLLEARDLRKSFVTGEIKTDVLKGVDLVLNPGDMAALLGPSGSGKSTLLTILGTLMRPSSGHISMLGQDLLRLGERGLSDFRNAHIGFVFQFHHLLPEFTALENVLFPAALRLGRETPAVRRRASELLDRMGLSNRIDYPSSKLSGGQKQRVAVARALMNEPELVLADEPTGNLDREAAKQVMALFQSINRESRTTFLISTHAEDIAASCSRRIQIQDGKTNAFEPR